MAENQNPFPPRSAENPEPITGWKISRVDADQDTETWVLELSNGEHFQLLKRTSALIADQTLGGTRG